MIVERYLQLRPRLRQVLEVLAAGWNIKGIADQLGIDQKTAEAHRTKLLQRLGLRSAVEAPRFYLENKPNRHRAPKAGRHEVPSKPSAIRTNS